MIAESMARNRKYRSAAARFGPAIKAFVLCLMIGGSGIGYVWQKNQIYELGRQIKERETKLHSLDVQNEKLKKQMAEMTTVNALVDRIKKLNLGLAAPALSQVWRLSEPGREPAKPQATPAAGPQYALQGSAAP